MHNKEVSSRDCIGFILLDRIFMYVCMYKYMHVCIYICIYV